MSGSFQFINIDDPTEEISAEVGEFRFTVPHEFVNAPAPAN
jgi:hypothetical protein